jgi:hypothetical protein
MVRSLIVWIVVQRGGPGKHLPPVGAVSGGWILVDEPLRAGRSAGARLRNAERFSQEEGFCLLHCHRRVAGWRCSKGAGVVYWGKAHAFLQSNEVTFCMKTRAVDSPEPPLAFGHLPLARGRQTERSEVRGGSRRKISKSTVFSKRAVYPTRRPLLPGGAPLCTIAPPRPTPVRPADAKSGGRAVNSPESLHLYHVN